MEGRGLYRVLQSVQKTPNPCSLGGSLRRPEAKLSERVGPYTSSLQCPPPQPGGPPRVVVAVASHKGLAPQGGIISVDKMGRTFDLTTTLK